MNDLTYNVCDLQAEIISREFGNLNEEQLKAVVEIKGPVLIFAGAGVGKTTTLIKRILNIIKYGDFLNMKNKSIELENHAYQAFISYVENQTQELPYEISEKIGICPTDPSLILVITFTNKAAKQLRTLLELDLGEKSQKINVGTFHSEFNKILKEFVNDLKLSENYSLYSEVEQKELIRECIEELNDDQKNALKINKKPDEKTIKKVLKEISRAKNTLLPIKSYSEIYDLYQDKLQSNNAIDIDDILFLVYELLLKFPNTLDILKERFRYVMVDEYQDTNSVQFAVIQKLTEKFRNLCVVGDDDQSIYGFRGADVNNILDFKHHFKDFTEIVLHKNYRSTQNILDVANLIIKENQNRKSKSIISTSSENEKVHRIIFNDNHEQTKYISRYIKDHCKEGDFGKFAIIYRTNAQSEILQTILKQELIPYNTYGGIDFYERREIKDIISYLKIVANPSDNLAFKRIIIASKCGIGKTTLKKIEDFAEENQCTMLDICRDCEKYREFFGRVSLKVDEAYETISKIQKKSRELHCKVSDLINFVLELTGWSEKYDSNTNLLEKTRAKNLTEFYKIALDHEKINCDLTVPEFLSKVCANAGESEYQMSNKVSLLTCHSSKGLEFDTVFVIGLEEGIFPCYGSPLEDERRLLYVSITRAKRTLFLCSSRCCDDLNPTKQTSISTFLKDIDEAFENKEDKFYQKGERNIDINNFMDYENLSQEMPSVQYYPRLSKKASQEINKVIKIDENFDKNKLLSFNTYNLTVDCTKKGVDHNIYSEGDLVEHSAFGPGVIIKIIKGKENSKLKIMFSKEVKIIKSDASNLKKIS